MLNKNLLLCCVLLSVCFIELSTAIRAENKDTVLKKGSHPATQQQHAYHVDILQRLKQSSSVVPDKPPVHPLKTVYNREAVIPPMCYTKTEGKYNPCYVCHQMSMANKIDPVSVIKIEPLFQRNSYLFSLDFSR